MVNFRNQFRGTYKHDRDVWIAAEQTKDSSGKLTIFLASYLVFDILAKKGDLEVRYICEVYYKQPISDDEVVTVNVEGTKMTCDMLSYYMVEKPGILKEFRCTGKSCSAIILLSSFYTDGLNQAFISNLNHNHYLVSFISIYSFFTFFSLLISSTIQLLVNQTFSLISLKRSEKSRHSKVLTKI